MELTKKQTYWVCWGVVLVSLLLPPLSGIAKSTPITPAFIERQEVQAFIDQTANKYHLSRDYIEKSLSQVELDPSVITAMKRPYEAKPWYQYRAHFLTQERIQKGAQFWRQHESALEKAEKTYGVPASVIVAIIGVETHYGKLPGSFSVLNTLATLGFDYKPRAQFFKKELAEFLVLSHELKRDPASFKGSYAGAIGQPQFMPSSYRHYAVDFTGDGKVDLFETSEDVIGSIANFLKENGWQANQPILSDPNFIKNNARKFANSKRETPYTIGSLKKRGINTEHAYQKSVPVNLFDLKTAGNQFTYWLGFHNFYVITRYNTSLLYAMAVYQLSQRLEHAYAKPKSAST